MIESWKFASELFGMYHDSWEYVQIRSESNNSAKMRTPWCIGWCPISDISNKY